MPMMIDTKVTMYKGMKEKHFNQIPYHYWAVETYKMMLATYPRLIGAWFTAPINTAKNVVGYTLATILLVIMTVLFPLAPFAMKQVFKRDLKEKGAFFIASTYVNNRLPTFAMIVGAEIESFNMGDEEDVERVRKILWEHQYEK